MARLHSQGLLTGRVLDYGCGRGFDCDYLGFDGFDPHYRPTPPVGPYDTIVCNYVLNVIKDDEDRRAVLKAIVGLLSFSGFAYVTVRRGKATRVGHTSRGTWQGQIELGLPVVCRDSDSITYLLARGGEDCTMSCLVD
jgi:hypothetical protein